MILVIDNYDSFTYNLVQCLGALGETPVVRRNDAVRIDEIADLAPRAIVLSPGPGVPADAGVTVEVVRRWSGRIPILGVCLGHQAIGEAFGGRVVRAHRVMHGKTSRIDHEGSELFAGLPTPLEVMRYHSLIVERASLPAAFRVTASSAADDGEVQAMRHRDLPVWGVQFHPESIFTAHGERLLKNFITLAGC
jgi:anthranilate synthase/aminodeoxychorismate synthase-like glutamine amidotransferase